jgi:cyanophycinase-like exopeptidase
MAIIRQRTEAGELVVSGSSAGTGVMGGSTLNGKKIPMISGGESYYALVDEPRTTACLTSKCADDLVYDPAGGFGLFDFGVIDMHFS